ncbi:hypothetical protein ACO22_03710 [Paracoccidioides brasiliensis]|uniref:Uncharacterized protein n=1 Tax=Paracoccidioides brasiliensis TaxID=121759 RepID=A0A1D2JF69_PARBR|nr:hypothetical protein ACO22_03710 [Paracoccidioides brasiliensis]
MDIIGYVRRRFDSTPWTHVPGPGHQRKLSAPQVATLSSETTLPTIGNHNALLYKQHAAQSEELGCQSLASRMPRQTLVNI